MSSGVTVADAAVEQFTAFKMQSNASKFMILKIDDKHVVVDKISEDSSLSALVAELPTDDCRYAVFKKNVEYEDGRSTEKLVLITWSPDTSRVKPKMVYASTKDAVVRALTGIMVKFHATDLSELTEEALTAECKKFG
jgi:cofilin